MLLLILIAGYLATCAAQTAPPTSSNTIQAASVTPATDSPEDVMAILLTAVRSTRELNETTIAPVLEELYSIIRQVRPDLEFSLMVKKITRV